MNKITIATHHRTFTTDVYTHMEKQWVYTLKLESKIVMIKTTIGPNINKINVLMFSQHNVPHNH